MKKVHKMSEAEVWGAVEELTRLYGGWLAYLLRLAGQESLRVSAAELSEAVKNFSCSVSREGEEYVIRLQGREERHVGYSEQTD